MCFRCKSLAQLYVPALYVDNCKLKFVEVITYLGVMINEEWNDNDHLL